MAKFKCTSCENEKEYSDVLTMRCRDGEIQHFDADDNRVDICECGSNMKELRTRVGFGGFVSDGRGGTGNFKKS
jgi:predicted nucleic acid-binding Zn ribbon protein